MQSAELLGGGTGSRGILSALNSLDVHSLQRAVADSGLLMRTIREVQQLASASYPGSHWASVIATRI